MGQLGQMSPDMGAMPQMQGGMPQMQGGMMPAAPQMSAPIPPTTNELENLAETMEPDRLREIAETVIKEYEADDDARSEWLEMHASWMRLYHQDDVPTNSMYDWASEESLPILAEACNQFAARAYKAFFPNRNIIKAVPIGKASEADWKRAERVSKHMSWQLLARDHSYKKNKRRLLLSCSVHGSHFTKTFYDPIKEKNTVVNVRASDLVVPYGTGPRDIEDLERKTHVIPMAVGKGARLAAAGFFIEDPKKAESRDDGPVADAANRVDGLTKGGTEDTSSDQAVILEQHRWLDLDDGEKPYIVWVDLEGRKVLRIARRWDDDPTEPVEHFTHYPFIENPDGFYGLGMGHLVGEINKSCNKLLRQMLDSATLANVGNHSGFMSQAVAPQGGETSMELGKFKKLAGSVEDLNRGIFQFKFPGPPQAMAEILNLIMARSDRLSSVTEMVSGAAEKVMQPTAVLALIEQAMEQYSSVYEGLFDAWGEELQKVYRLNGKYLPVQEYFTVLDAQGPEVQQVMQTDYLADLQIMPLADPKMATEQQRLTRGQVEYDFLLNYHATLLQMPAPIQPFIYKAALQFAETIQMDDADQKLSPPPPPPEPKRIDDPMIENMMALMPGQPQVPDVALDQNHLEHLKAHETFLVDPAYADRFPPGGKEAMTQHIQKHVALLYGLTEADMGHVMEGASSQPAMGATA